MASKYLIGLDIGTSGAKCILVDDKGNDFFKQIKPRCAGNC